MAAMAECPAMKTWSKPPETPVIEDEDVHVWRVALDQPEEIRLDLERCLAAGEHERAARFHFQRDRDHFIVARGCLRQILGSYLQAAPDRLNFSYSPYGKPYLTGPSTPDGLQFNLSHSHSLALIAVTRGRQVGVDIEYTGRELADEQIARRFFSVAEVAALLALPRPIQIEAFFTCWTRKEAYIKARGEGLSLPLDQFDVTLAPGQPAVLLATRPDAQEVRRWTLRELEPGPGYAAALAVEGRLGEVLCWQLEYRSSSGPATANAVRNQPLD